MYIPAHPVPDRIFKDESRCVKMDTIVNFLYADGDVLMTLCRIVSFVFGLESLAYLVGIIANIAKTAKG
jgi:hypothetical protein